MNAKCAIYLGFCIVGTLLPYSQIVPWSIEHGWDIPKFFEDLSANQISAFAWADVSISALAFLFFQEVERQRIGMKFPWASLVSVFLVGLSLGLPLFLFLREMHLSKKIANS